MKKNKTILITGGSGYIGGMTCRLLVKLGNKVINIDRVKKSIPMVKQYVLDIGSDKLKTIIKKENPDTIMHFAADHEIEKSTSQPDSCYTNNVLNSIKLLNLVIETRIKNFIFSSTSAVYGEITNFPTTEETLKKPISPYGKSKSMVEDILEDYEKSYNLKYVSLRYFNAAGACPDLNHGYNQDPPTHIVPVIAKKIILNEALEIYGNNYNTKDGTAERDYIHLYDIAEAHISAMNYLDNNGKSDVFNIGANSSNSILDVVKTFEKVCDTNIEYKFVDRREGDPARTLSDNTKAKKILNWSPKYSLEKIVEHSYLWEKSKRKIF